MSKFSTSSSNRRLYKIVLLGDGGVGKTSLRHRYLGQGFKANYMATIGADFAINKVDDITILQIWDLAGQQRFSVVREGYYIGTRGALLVFDITRPDTFHSIPNWIGELLNNLNHDEVIPLVLIGNKSDLRDDEDITNYVTYEQAEAYAKELANWSEMPVPYVETSAKTGLNVDLIFSSLLDNIQTREGIIT